jgi:hypothetical protein
MVGEKIDLIKVKNLSLGKNFLSIRCAGGTGVGKAKNCFTEPS